MNAISFNDLSGKVCVITGGAGVIGAAMVKAMASVGVKIAIADINKEVAERVAAEISKEYNAEVIGVEANVLDKESLIKAKAVINEKFGDIDMLINGAVETTQQQPLKWNKWTKTASIIWKIRSMVYRWTVLIKYLP